MEISIQEYSNLIKAENTLEILIAVLLQNTEYRDYKKDLCLKAVNDGILEVVKAYDTKAYNSRLESLKTE